ncbi:hypothetical protein ACFONC_14905 [Luteimonas soli]|uniref:Uncharacterized protein n=1 Tax=Luteimonas soli TaxID=1648966 RepID=A0ABV7XN89_9GAMM
MKRCITHAASMLLLLWVSGANACVTFPPIETPDIRKVADSADIVAVIHVDQVGWRTPEEEAEFHRLWERPPMDEAFSYPARSAQFSVERIFKGQVPANVSIRSGSVDCEIILTEGQDYVLFANLPSDDDRLVPLRGTFPLDATRHSAALLADLESHFTHSNSTSP